jgi:Gram-negative bacterial TonB protein C-terminal
MKLHFIILFFVTLGVFSQNENSEDEVFLLSVVDKKPEYPGGIEALTSFIAGNIDLPINNVFDGGRVIVSFTVNKDGILSDIKIIKGIGLGINNEIIRLMNSCNNWIPGEIENKKVRVNYVLPIILPKSEIELEITKNFIDTDSISLGNDLEVKPDFVGGVEAFYQFVGRNFRVPMVEGLKGKVLASFVIENRW